MKHFNLGSIRKNLAFLVLLAVLPALAIMLNAGIEQRHNSIKQAKQDVIRLTQTMAEVQQDITMSAKQMLSTLAMLPAIQNFDLQAVNKIFAGLIKQNPGYYNMTLSAVNGQVLAAGKGYVPVSLADRKHFREALQDRDFSAGEYILTRLGPSAPVFAFAYPVLDKEGQPKAVLTAVIDLTRFTNFYQTSSLPDKSFIAVTDHQGIRILYYPPNPATNQLGKQIKAKVWELTKSSTLSGSFNVFGSDGENRIIAFEPLRLSPDKQPYIYVWAGVPEASILANADAAMTRNLLLMLLAATLALFIAGVLGKQALVTPIETLVVMTKKFTAGDLDYRSELTNKKDEIGTLAAAFHDMAAAIKEGQRALQENEARFRLTMDSLDALVYVADMNTYEILFINEYGRKKFGDVTGKLCWQHLQKNQTGPCPFCTNKLLLDDSGQPTKVYSWEFRNTATERWYDIHDRAIRWIDNRIVRLEIATDSTERKLAETNLAEETERLAVTLRSIADGVITTDTEGNIILINQVAAALTGWDSKEATGQSLTDVFTIIDKETKQPCESPVEKVLIAGEIIGPTSQSTLIDKSGREKTISNSGAPITDGNGKTIGVVLVFRNITKQLRTEQELVKIKKLESIGVLAGGIAHDFNNILAAILGNIDLSLRDPNITDRTQRLLNQAQKASFRARDLTQQLLTFSKGGQPIKAAASLAEVVKESAEFVLRGDKVACRYQFPTDLWLGDIDKGQISQVIQNIILNASNAMPDGGTIEVSAQNVNSTEVPETALASNTHYVLLTVKDTGIGIPTHLIDKIFDPFFTTKQQGSGLGLAITHSIVSKHGGAISVESTLSVGTTFNIYLPASLGNIIPEQETTDEKMSTHKAKVLVMDDEDMVRGIASEMLYEIGHEVIGAKDGAEAIQAYQAALNTTAPIDVVIMDLTIPGGMGGEVAVQRILTLHPEAKVIVSSGYSNDPVMANFQNYGFCAAIVKPYQLTELAETINQVVG